MSNPFRFPFRPPGENHAPVPEIDPKNWADHSVFRQIFLVDLSAEDVEGFQAFGRSLRALANEGGSMWQGTPADATGYFLAAVAADLRVLEGYLEFSGELDDDVLVPHTPRNVRWCRFASQTARKLAEIAKEIENELEEGVVEKDALGDAGDADERPRYLT